VVFYIRTVASEDYGQLGRRIAEARQRAGHSQAGLALMVGLDRSALAKIEIGGRRVTALELARLAEALGERIEWFVNAPPPSIVSHRNLQTPGESESIIDREVELAARDVEFLARHDAALRLAQAEVSPRPLAPAEAESLALRARALLGLSPEEPVLEVADRVASLGLIAFSFDLGPDAADAASVLLPRGAVAVVNGGLHVGRRRLALVHELGHYLVADEYTVDWRLSERGQDEISGENLIDRFARAVLLPAAGMEAAWSADFRGGEELRSGAVKVASRFRVDMSTLSRRLAELRLLAGDAAGRIRGFRTTKADILEFGLVTREEFRSPGLSTAYQESVLRLYRAEAISAARALGLLRDTWTEEDLPDVPPSGEHAIWDFVS